MTGDGVVHRRARSPAAPIHVIRRLRIVEERLLRIVVPVGNVFSTCVDKSWNRRAMLGFVNAAVHFVAQPVVQSEARRGFPRVLEVEVISLAPDGGFIELVALGCDVRGGDDPVRIRSSGQQSGERIRQRVAGLDIVSAARRCDQHG